jgi:antitoxin component YwqK of YwqJK toxin-antitoxin module
VGQFCVNINTQINNGKVYAGDSNTPFSGNVTNVPAATIFGAQPGYGKLLDTINTARPGTTLRDMGMSSMCDAQARDGLLSGQVICKTSQSDTVRVEATFTDGLLDGSFTVHDQAGKDAFVKVSFKQGMPDGMMKIFSAATGKLVHTATWDRGVLSGNEEGFDETTGNRILQATLSNGKYAGEFNRYAPDGKQLVYRINYIDGQPTGDEKAFDPQSGRMTGQAHYVNGKLDGKVQQWTASGDLVYESEYRNGAPIEDNEIVKACTTNLNRDLNIAAPDAEDIQNEVHVLCLEASSKPAPATCLDAKVSGFSTDHPGAVLEPEQMKQMVGACRS